MQVENGIFSIDLPVDTVVTLSTLSGQQKGSFPDIPPSSPFPIPYSDNFDSERGSSKSLLSKIRAFCTRISMSWVFT